MSLQDLVNVQITTEATAPARANFGLPLAAGFHTVFTERSRSYTSIDAMVSDGFGANDPLVNLVGVILSQNPKVDRVLVGRLANAPLRTIRLTPLLAALTARANTTFSLVVNGAAVSVALGATPTVAAFVTDLKTAIDALTLTGVTTTDNGTDLLITCTAGNECTVEVDRQVVQRKDETVDPDASTGGPGGGTVEDLIAISDENDDWYQLVLAQDSSAIAQAVAAYIQTRFKTFITVSGDDDILDQVATTDLMSELLSSSFSRTAAYYHPRPHEYLSGGHAGVELPLDPGSYTMFAQQLAGVSQVRMSDTEKNTVFAKRGNTFTPTAGLTFIERGVVSAAGEFIDVVRFVDFFRNDLQVSILARLVNLDKIPFTDAGIAIIESEIRAALARGIAVGGLAATPEPTVDVPRVADVSFVDRAARIVRGITFAANLAGAVHEIRIQGTFSA